MPPVPAFYMRRLLFTAVNNFSTLFHSKVLCQNKNTPNYYNNYIIMNGQNVKVHVEYCGTCGHQKQYSQMVKHIYGSTINVDMEGTPGRQGAFEVKVNGQLVYSKLQTLAFPDFDEAAEMLRGVAEGRPIVKLTKQQPINCVIA